MRILLLRKKRVAAAAVCALCLSAIMVLLVIRSASLFCFGEGEAYVKVPVIMYHLVLEEEEKAGSYTVTCNQLEEDLRHIRDKGYTTITVSDLADYVCAGKPLPKKPIILSFDDGYYNNYRYVLPLMQKYDMKMVFAVVGAFADGAGKMKGADPDYSYATWAQIAEMYYSGRAEIQNHSYALHSIGDRWGSMRKEDESIEQYGKALTEDLLLMQQRAALYLGGYRPSAFVYPFGGVSPEAGPIIKRLGFKASFSCVPGINLISKNPDSLYSLKRMQRTGDETTSAFFDRIEG